MHRPAVSAPLPGLFITSLPRRQRCGSGAAANNGAEAGAALGGFPWADDWKGMDMKCRMRLDRISGLLLYMAKQPSLTCADWSQNQEWTFFFGAKPQPSETLYVWKYSITISAAIITQLIDYKSSRKLIANSFDTLF